jgi:hypothetical protein
VAIGEAKSAPLDRELTATTTTCPPVAVFRGHLAGEAACPMKNDNPHDWARQQKEDPMTFMKKGILEHKQKLILRHASIPSELRNHELLVDQLVHSDDEEIGESTLCLFISLWSQRIKILKPNSYPL